MKFAEETQEVEYKKDEQGNVLAEPKFNEDGSPQMIKKTLFPSFYVHHKAAITDDNQYGFIGGFEGASTEDLDAVIGMIQGVMNG